MNRESLPPRSIGALMLGLAQLGLFGFGGVGPQAYHFFVEQTGWVSSAEFAERYSIAQALPGANTVNLCAILGDRWFGPLGAVAAAAAITLPPLAVVLVAASALAKIEHAPHFVAAECAVVAASAGLILATAVRICSSITRRRTIGFVLVGLVAYAVASNALSMPVATLVALVAGFAVDYFMRTRA